MRRPTERPVPAPTDWLEAHVEAFVDGELSAEEAGRFRAAVRADPAWRLEVERARLVRRGLRTLPRPACPPEVTAAVLAEVERRSAAARPAPRRRDRPARRLRGLGRPLATAGLLVALVAAAALVTPPPRPAPTGAYSVAEVDRATAQVRWTLALVADVGAATGEAVEPVLRDRVASPLERALDEVLDEPDRL